MKNLLESIEDFKNDTVEADLTKKRFIQFIEQNPDCLLRGNLKGHLTASAFIVDFIANRILLLHHKKLNKWLQPGGHCDGDGNTLLVAIKEVFEETGITILPQNQPIVDLDIHTIPEKNLVPEHEHFDVRYLFEVDANSILIKNHESIDLKWVEFSEINQFSEEENLLKFIQNLHQYKKL